MLVLAMVSLLAGCAYAADPLTVPAITPVISIPPGGDQGYFLINSVPLDADVYFDGVFEGETPVTIVVSTTGNPSHTIRITRGGYEPWSTTYQGNPRPGETIAVTAMLTPAVTSGTIRVTSSPSGATSTLDRSQSQSTPFTYTSVPVGNHEVSVYLSGYQTYYTSVTVQQGQTAEVYAQLSPVITSGALSVISTPESAAVYVDGVYRGVTLTTVGNLAPGQHTVVLSKSGYKDWMGQVSIQTGVVTSISPILEKDPEPVSGTVSISSVPPGADVYADGIYVGQTRAGSPLVFTRVAPGTHTLLLTRTGYQDSATTGVVRAGENYALILTLTQNPQSTTGGISIVSSPSGTEVFLNNVYRGPSPLTIGSLPEGNYPVLLRLSGYQDWQSEIPVTAGQTVQVTATMNPSPAPTRSGVLPVVLPGGLAIAAVLLSRRK
ncbi:MAG: PEGA domain-containing protein [Methanolinea sp.]|nr:PEGA domain-containing protein [Methanolinea sp.]